MDPKDEFVAKIFVFGSMEPEEEDFQDRQVGGWIGQDRHPKKVKRGNRTIGDELDSLTVAQLTLRLEETGTDVQGGWK